MQTLAIAKRELWLHRDDRSRRNTSVHTNGYELNEWRNGTATPIGRHELVETVVAG